MQLNPTIFSLQNSRWLTLCTSVPHSFHPVQSTTWLELLFLPLQWGLPRNNEDSEMDWFCRKPFWMVMPILSISQSTWTSFLIESLASDEDETWGELSFATGSVDVLATVMVTVESSKLLDVEAEEFFATGDDSWFDIYGYIKVKAVLFQSFVWVFPASWLESTATKWRMGHWNLHFIIPFL